MIQKKMDLIETIFNHVDVLLNQLQQIEKLKKNLYNFLIDFLSSLHPCDEKYEPYVLSTMDSNALISRGIDSIIHFSRVKIDIVLELIKNSDNFNNFSNFIDNNINILLDLVPGRDTRNELTFDKLFERSERYI